MAQLLGGGRRRTAASAAQVQTGKAVHQIVAAAGRSRRRWLGWRRIEETHHVGHAPARLRGAGGRAGDPVGRGGGAGLLQRSRRAAIKVDVEEVLNVVLGTGAVGGGGGGRGGNGVLGCVLALFENGGALDGLGAEPALANKRLGGLVVNRGQC